MSCVCACDCMYKSISCRMSKRVQHRISSGGKQGEYVTMKCYLCSSKSPTNVYSKPSAWSEQHRQWVNSMCTSPIPLDVTVCRACEKFIKRHTGKMDVVPRWLPKLKHHKYCMKEGCGEIAHTTTSMSTYDVAQEHLDLVDVQDCQTESDTSSPLALCSCHYQQLYRALRFPLPCAACSSQPRYGGDYTRRCPNPVKITAYLQETVDFDGVISADSKVCKPCYDFHRQILQQQICSESAPISTLHDIASQLEEKIARFEAGNAELTTDNEYLGWVVCQIALKLAKILQRDEAILLPELHRQFCQLLTTSIDGFPNVHKSLKTNLPTNRWLLSSIGNHLKDTLGIVCKHRRYGTLLYSRNGDLLNFLSKALGSGEGLRKSEAYIRQEHSSVLKADSGKLTGDTILQACLALNVRMNRQVHSIIQTYQNDPWLCESFDPDVMLR